MRNFILGFAACYLAVALLAATAMHRVLPALNWRGAAYVGLLHPYNLWCLQQARGNCGLPEKAEDAQWMFTFEEEEGQ